MQRAYFDDFEPGQDWGAHSWTTSEAICRRWQSAGLGGCPEETDPANSDRRLRAPPALVLVALSQAMQDRLRDKPPGGVHAKQSLAFHAPVFADDVLTTSVAVKAKYVKRERRYVEFETKTVNQAGELVLSALRTVIWAG